MTEKEIVSIWLTELLGEIFEDAWIEYHADELLTNLRLAAERQPLPKPFDRESDK